MKLKTFALEVMKRKINNIMNIKVCRVCGVEYVPVKDDFAQERQECCSFTCYLKAPPFFTGEYDDEHTCAADDD